MLLHKRFFVISFLFAFMITSCGNDDATEPVLNPDPYEDHIELGRATEEDGYDQMVIYAKSSPIVGYNELLFVLRDPDNRVLDDFTEYEVSLYPEMEMSTMKHSTPFADHQRFNADGAYEAAVIFVMPQEAGDWFIDVQLTRDNEPDKTFRVPVENVENPAEKRVKSFTTGPDSITYFVTYVEPTEPEVVGKSDFVLMVHQRKNTEDWPHVKGLEFIAEPEMPDMGHGSDGNEDPVHEGDGRYEGKLNFNMAGYWKINLEVYRGDELIKDDLFFDVTF